VLSIDWSLVCLQLCCISVWFTIMLFFSLELHFSLVYNMLHWFVWANLFCNHLELHFSFLKRKNCSNHMIENHSGRYVYNNTYESCVSCFLGHIYCHLTSYFIWGLTDYTIWGVNAFETCHLTCYFQFWTDVSYWYHA
jgi:hypothetical protein